MSDGCWEQKGRQVGVPLLTWFPEEELSWYRDPQQLPNHRDLATAFVELYIVTPSYT